MALKKIATDSAQPAYYPIDQLYIELEKLTYLSRKYSDEQS